jgi:hypothetical protein
MAYSFRSFDIYFKSEPCLEMLEVRLIPEYLNVLSNLLWSKKLYMLKVAAWQKAFQIITKKSRKLWSITSREMTGLLPTTEFPNYPQNDSIHCIVREQKSTSVPVTIPTACNECHGRKYQLLQRWIYTGHWILSKLLFRGVVRWLTPVWMFTACRGVPRAASLVWSTWRSKCSVIATLHDSQKNTDLMDLWMYKATELRWI